MGESAGEGAETGRLNDISARGALVRVGRKFDVGTRIRLLVKLPPPTEEWIGFFGQVVRVEKGSTGVDTALRFDMAQPMFTNLR